MGGDLGSTLAIQFEIKKDKYSYSGIHHRIVAKLLADNRNFHEENYSELLRKEEKVYKYKYITYNRQLLLRITKI